MKMNTQGKRTLQQRWQCTEKERERERGGGKIYGTAVSIATTPSRHEDPHPYILPPHTGTVHTYMYQPHLQTHTHSQNTRLAGPGVPQGGGLEGRPQTTVLPDVIGERVGEDTASATSLGDLLVGMGVEVCRGPYK